MTVHELQRRFPNASSDFLERNADCFGLTHEVDCPSPRPEPEPIVRHEPVGAESGESPHPASFHVRVTSFRRRLCDPDNLCPKYFIDCLRYSGYLRDDTAQDITLETSQRKVASAKDERTEIEIM